MASRCTAQIHTRPQPQVSPGCAVLSATPRLSLAPAPLSLCRAFVLALPEPQMRAPQISPRPPPSSVTFSAAVTSPKSLTLAIRCHIGPHDPIGPAWALVFRAARMPQTVRVFVWHLLPSLLGPRRVTQLRSLGRSRACTGAVEAGWGGLSVRHGEGHLRRGQRSQAVPAR